MSRFVGFQTETAGEDFAAYGQTRVLAWADLPIMTLNTTVRAWVGTEELVGITVDEYGLGFSAYAAGPVATDATLSVQIDGGDRFDTGLTADDPLVA